VATVSYTYTLPTAIETATAIVATDMLAQARLAQRGMIGLSSIRVANVAITALAPSQNSYVTRNGVTIPLTAASLLTGYTMGSIA
jgi:hypothetical protein